MTEPDPFFLDGRAGRLLAVRWASRTVPSERALLVVPPFAEEMNKCRPMMARAAAAYGACHGAALLVDLYGTGDSEGDFRDGTVARWRDDLRAAAAWFEGQGVRTLDVLAIRAGALLPVRDIFHPGLAPGRLALWQPVVRGQQAMTQFLRMRLAGAMFAGQPDAGEDPRAVARDQGYVEVAGYDVNQTLVREFDDLLLSTTLAAGWKSLLALEVAEASGAPASPALRRALEGLDLPGGQATIGVVAGDPFWSSPEIATVPELVRRTSEFFE
jgi:exosortase A-associated hydrolase 2